MKFLTEKGKIEEGTPLTDEQVSQRTNLIGYFHETACENAYHGTYSARPCENLANAFVTGAIAEAANKQLNAIDTDAMQEFKTLATQAKARALVALTGDLVRRQ